MTAPAPIVAVFGRTSQDLLAVRVEDLVWLAVPVSGGIKIASGWRLTKPMPDWTAADFHGAEGVVTDEAAFRVHVQAIAEHRRQVPALSRQTIHVPVETPWGWPDTSIRYAEGIVSYSTPSHGGFHLDEIRNTIIAEPLRNKDGWYEEDCEWAKVAVAFPDLFTDYEREHAERTLRNSFPDAWEAFHGRMLAAGESWQKDQRQFYRDHERDWIVISALRSRDHPGMVECHATLGGDRAAREVRCFLVPDAEYAVRRFGFVIDEVRHALV